MGTPFLIEPCRALAGKRGLAVGCGRGIGLGILLELRAAHITHFDLDPKQVGLAQARVAKYHARAIVHIGSAEVIEASDTSSDAVVAHSIFHHVPIGRRRPRTSPEC